MGNVTLTASADTSGLRRAIPEIVAFGRRTMEQQCVTSLAFICKDAMELTTTTALGRIDSDLNKQVSVKGGKSNKMTVGQAVVLARMSPKSRFNAETGGRWAMARPDTNVSGIGKASRGSSYFGMKQRELRALWEFIDNADARQRKARRSSANYIKSGWKASIRILFGHKDFVGRRRGAIDKGQLNSLNTMRNDMGAASVAISGDQVMAIASNDAGEAEGKSNATLARKHRNASLEHALPAAQAAVEHEEREIARKISEYMERGLEKFSKQLS